MLVFSTSLNDYEKKTNTLTQTPRKGNTNNTIKEVMINQPLSQTHAYIVYNT